VRRQGIKDSKRFDTTTFYISSANLSAWCFAKVIRGHGISAMGEKVSNLWSIVSSGAKNLYYMFG
jgi:hypothetical protein